MYVYQLFNLFSILHIENKAYACDLFIEALTTQSDQQSRDRSKINGYVTA